jgi:hypothetical protein
MNSLLFIIGLKMTNFDEGKKSLHRMASTPGTFQFKIKSYNNEEGEYSAWQQAEPGAIIQLVLTHWFNATLPNNLDIIVIKNEKNDQLVIDHENKDVFRFFLIPSEKGLSYYYKMTDIRFMFFTLEHFFNGLIDILKENLNKTIDDWRWVKGDFIQKNFHHKITNGTLLRHFIGGIATFVVWLLLLLSLAFGLSDIGQFIFFSVFIVGFALWSLPNNLRWYHDQQHLAITLSKGDRFIHLWYKNDALNIPKADIVSIHQHFTRDEDIWTPRFTQIDFANGDTLNLHELLMPQGEIKDKFFQERHLYQQLNSNTRSGQKKTSLTNYFPRQTGNRYVR